MKILTDKELVSLSVLGQFLKEFNPNLHDLVQEIVLGNGYGGQIQDFADSMEGCEDGADRLFALVVENILDIIKEKVTVEY